MAMTQFVLEEEIILRPTTTPTSQQEKLQRAMDVLDGSPGCVVHEMNSGYSGESDGHKPTVLMLDLVRDNPLGKGYKGKAMIILRVDGSWDVLGQPEV